MCRPDDFPPYDMKDSDEEAAWLDELFGVADAGAPCQPEASDADWRVEGVAPRRVGETPAEFAARVAEMRRRGDAVHDDDHDPDLVAQPLGMFRSLDATEEQAFRAWARANWQPGQYVNPVWHPVVRDECRVMTAERAR